MSSEQPSSPPARFQPKHYITRGDGPFVPQVGLQMLAPVQNSVCHDLAEVVRGSSRTFAEVIANRARNSVLEWYKMGAAEIGANLVED